MRILATVDVGSHLETVYAIEKALRADNPNLQIVIADIVGFHDWDATSIPYSGQAKRMQFSPAYCGLPRDQVTSRTWKLVKQGGLRLLRRANPDILLTIVDSGFGTYALLQCAKELDLPTLMIQEGPFRGPHIRQASLRECIQEVRVLIRRVLNPIRGFRNKPWLPPYGGGGADRLAVASSHYAALFNKAGVSAERIVVTGIPRYDVLLQAREIRSQNRERSRKASNRINILLLSQPFLRYGLLHLEEYTELCRMIADGLERLMNSIPLNLVVRLHPSETVKDVEPLTAELQQPYAVQSHQPLTSILSEFDLVIGFSSSGLLEAMTVGIPAVCVDADAFSTFPQTVWFRQARVPVATSAKELSELCIAAIELGKPQVNLRMLTNETGQIDGKASERVAKLCQALTHIES